jgi:hypothetical protein
VLLPWKLTAIDFLVTVVAQSQFWRSLYLVALSTGTRFFIRLHLKVLFQVDTRVYESIQSTHDCGTYSVTIENVVYVLQQDSDGKEHAW